MVPWPDGVVARVTRLNAPSPAAASRTLPFVTLMLPGAALPTLRNGGAKTTSPAEMIPPLAGAAAMPKQEQEIAAAMVFRAKTALAFMQTSLVVKCSHDCVGHERRCKSHV